jgi:hypothetical protein
MSIGFEQQQLAREAAERSRQAAELSRRAAEEAQRQAREATARGVDEGLRSSREAVLRSSERHHGRGRDRDAARRSLVGRVFHAIGFTVKLIVFLVVLAVIAGVALYVLSKR